jgi:hypothetical protein
MSSQSKSNPVIESIESAAEHVAEMNAKAVETSRKAGDVYLSSYEKAVVAIADSYERAAGATKIDWVASIATLQADVTRQLAQAYTSAARVS